MSLETELDHLAEKCYQKLNKYVANVAITNRLGESISNWYVRYCNSKTLKDKINSLPMSVLSNLKNLNIESYYEYKLLVENKEDIWYDFLTEDFNNQAIILDNIPAMQTLMARRLHGEHNDLDIFVFKVRYGLHNPDYAHWATLDAQIKDFENYEHHDVDPKHYDVLRPLIEHIIENLTIDNRGFHIFNNMDIYYDNDGYDYDEEYDGIFYEDEIRRWYGDDVVNMLRRSQASVLAKEYEQGRRVVNILHLLNPPSFEM